MFSRTATKRSTGAFCDDLTRLRQELAAADAVLVGAGAGLSAAAGFTYTGDRFARYFGDFMQKYGFRDMYAGGFYPFDSFEEHWAYWSRYIYINRYLDPPRPVYRDLLRLVGDKDYFVLTTNVDHCFQKAGFDKHRLFYTQGDYGLCSAPAPATPPPTTTPARCAGWWRPRGSGSGRASCCPRPAAPPPWRCPPGWYPAARSAAGP